MLVSKNIDPYESAIATYCDDLKAKMLEKYRRGREEHGGQPTAIDCAREINQEVLDILNYFVIERVNRRDF